MAYNFLQQRKQAIQGAVDYTRQQQEAEQQQRFKLEQIRAQQQGKPEKISPFEEAKQKRYAEIYSEAQDNLAKSSAVFSDLNRARSLAEDLRGLFGYGKALIGSETAAELDALGTTLIEPIIKIFNPVGAIPVAKINLIRDKHAPKATDRHVTILGKINAIERFNRNAQKRAQTWLNILNQYNGNPPPEALAVFTDEGEQMADEFEKEMIAAVS